MPVRSTMSATIRFRLSAASWLSALIIRLWNAVPLKYITNISLRSSLTLPAEPRAHSFLIHARLATRSYHRRRPFGLRGRLAACVPRRDGGAARDAAGSHDGRP